MSDSDDTDFLLLIPPNFFLVDDLETDDLILSQSKINSEVVSDLIGHVNSLENRVSAIESLDTSLHTVHSENEKHSLVSIKKNVNCAEKILINSLDNKNDQVLNWVTSSPFKASRSSNATVDLLNSNSPKCSVNTFLGGANSASYMSELGTTDVNEAGRPGPRKLELTEVDRLLREMEQTQRDIELKLKSREEFDLSHELYRMERDRGLLGDNVGSVPDLGFGVRGMFNDSPHVSPQKRLSDPRDPKTPVSEEACSKKTVSMLGAESRADADRWRSQLPREKSSTPAKVTPSKSPERRRPVTSLPSARRKLTMDPEESSTAGQERSEKPDTPARTLPSPSDSSRLHFSKYRELHNGFGDGHHSQAPSLRARDNPTASLYNNNLLSLNDLWKTDDDAFSRNPIKLKQKLEEEKFRRIHLEERVQALQKRVLEGEEKVAVAMQVDEKKDEVIERVTEAWKKMVDHWRLIEEQRHQASQALLSEKALTKRAQQEVDRKISRWEKEVSQALDLAAGFKTKAENLERQKYDLENEFAEKLKEVEMRLRETEQTLEAKNQDLHRTRASLEQANSALQQERAVVESTHHEVLQLEDTIKKFEEELTLVNAQKDNLSLMLKESQSHSSYLTQQKNALQEALNESKEKQAEAEEGQKSTKRQLETIKMELKSVYQSQLESVVREKLAEFQAELEEARGQLRSQGEAEVAAVREAATRHQQALVLSHVSEMRRLESLHKEEMLAVQRRLSEAEGRCARLERGKREVAQRLHSVMEAQWQQALGIITKDLSPPPHHRGGEEEPRGLDESLPSHDTSAQQTEPPPAPSQASLYSYIQMLLDKQPGRPVDSLASSGAGLDSTHEGLDESSSDLLKWSHLIGPAIEQRLQQERGGSRKPPWK